MRSLELRIRPECREKNRYSDFPTKKKWVGWPHFKCVLTTRAFISKSIYVQSGLFFQILSHITLLCALLYNHYDRSIYFVRLFQHILIITFEHEVFLQLTRAVLGISVSTEMSDSWSSLD